jgi:hypothetical protein
MTLEQQNNKRWRKVYDGRLSDLNGLAGSAASTLALD